VEGHTEGIMRLCKFSKLPKQIKFTALYNGFKHFHYSAVDPQSKISDDNDNNNNNNNNNNKDQQSSTRINQSTQQHRNMQFAYVIIRAVDST
jgi:hypothetical protein